MVKTDAAKSSRLAGKKKVDYNVDIQLGECRSRGIVHSAARLKELVWCPDEPFPHLRFVVSAV